MKFESLDFLAEPLNCALLIVSIPTILFYLFYWLWGLENIFKAKSIIILELAIIVICFWLIFLFDYLRCGR